MTHVEMLFLALILDAVLGEPEWLWSKVPHPARLMGRAVEFLDRKLNAGGQRQLTGIVACAALVTGFAVVGYLIAWLPDYGILEILGTAILLAHRSLVDHVRAVYLALDVSLEAGRVAVARIVGRDVNALDESSVSRAAIESAAENFSDGVVAPAFWFLLFGLPGILIYKAVNTADSMIGHPSTKYAEFGWASARLDDVLNWVPARLTGRLICLVYRSRPALETMLEDADLHRSPNSGWPEAAMAGVLGVALSGPRSYAGELTRDPYINGSGRRVLTRGDVARAISVLWRSWTGILALTFVLSAIVIVIF